MLTMKISIIEHSDLFVRVAPSKNKRHLARVRFKDDDEDLVSHKNLQRELGDDYISPCSQLTYKADRQAANQRIREHRCPVRISKTPILMQVPDVAETLNLIDYFIIIILCNLFYDIVIL